MPAAFSGSVAAPRTDDFLNAFDRLKPQLDAPCEFALRDGDRIWHGTRPDALREAFHRADEPSWLVDLSRVGNNTLMSVSARFDPESRDIDTLRLAYLSDGFPDHHQHLKRIAAEFGTDDLTHTTSTPTPALRLSYPRQQGVSPHVTVNRHVVDKETKQVIGAVIDNPLRTIPAADHIGTTSPSLSNVTADARAIHENNFDDDVQEQVATPDCVYARVETPHAVDEGYEYELSRIGVLQLSPLYGGRRLWNISTTIRARGRTRHPLPDSRQ